MAYLPDEQNLQTQNNGAPSQGGGQQAPITTSPAPTAGGSAGKTINQASSSAPAQPFTNLQAYLSANAPQIQAQGDTIAGTLNQTYGDTTKAIDNAKSSFGNDVAAGYTPNNAQVVNNFSADPSKVAADPNAAKTFTGMYNDKYTGPSSFEQSGQYGAVNDQVNKGVATAKQLGTPSGVQSYLMGQNPNETQGMATLDSSLLGANPDAVSTVTNAAKKYDQLPSYLTDASTAANGQVTAAQAEAQAAKDAAQGAATNVRGGLTSGMASEDADAAGKYNQSIKDYLNYSNVLGDANNIRNIASEFHQALPEYAVPDIFGELDKPAAGPSIYDPAAIRSSHDYATDAALAQLTGASPLLDPSKAGMAGSWNPTSYTPPSLAALAAHTADPLFVGGGATVPVDNAKIAELSALLKQLQQYNGQVPSSPITPTPTPGPVLQPPTVNPNPGHVAF